MPLHQHSGGSGAGAAYFSRDQKLVRFRRNERLSGSETNLVHSRFVLPEIESRSTRALRFARALIVGGGATLTDVSVFTLCVRALGISPSAARLPALLAGASLQF